MTTALVCPRCAAPLPPPTGFPVVICSYCGTPVQLGAAALPPAPAEAKSPWQLLRESGGWDRFRDAFTAARKQAGLTEALTRAAQGLLEPIGFTPAMARGVTLLATRFQADSGIDVSSDAMVIQRLIEAYVKARAELATAASAELNLPFLAADRTGPKHLQMQLGRDEVAAAEAG